MENNDYKIAVGSTIGGTQEFIAIVLKKDYPYLKKQFKECTGSTLRTRLGVHLSYGLCHMNRWEIKIKGDSTWGISYIREATRWEKLFLLKAGVFAGIDKEFLDRIRKSIHHA